MALNEQQVEPPKILWKAVRTLITNLSGSLLPTFIALLILMLFKKSSLIIQLGDKGDFLLYSAGLYTSSLYLLNDNKNDLKEIDNYLQIFAIFMIGCTSAIYGTLYASSNVFNEKMLELIKISINIGFIRYSSLCFFICAIGVGLRAIYIDTKKYARLVDVRAESRQDVNSIMNQLPD